MKLETVIAKLKDGFESEQERGEVLTRLTKNEFTSVSMATIMQCQETMFFEDKLSGTKRPFEEFAKAMDKSILECVEIEMSDLGEMVRKIGHKQPLTLDTEI